jgi:hypothetical protein
MVAENPRFGPVRDTNPVLVRRSGHPHNRTRPYTRQPSATPLHPRCGCRMGFSSPRLHRVETSSHWAGRDQRFRISRNTSPELLREYAISGRPFQYFLAGLRQPVFLQLKHFPRKRLQPRDSPLMSRNHLERHASTGRRAKENHHVQTTPASDSPTPDHHHGR